MYQFPLAVFLCAFAGNNVFFAYSNWYDVRQHVPSPENPEESQFPANFDEFLKMNPGEPLEEAIWDGRKCSRQFKNFKIFVDIEDESSPTWSF